MNKRFPLLSIISIVMRVVGWVLLVPATIKFIAALVSLSDRSASFALLSLPFAAGIAATGFAMIFTGEIVCVFFAIESHTRRTADMLEFARADERQSSPQT
jgi:hypothetical protein